jgi:hypothetical protein
MASASTPVATLPRAGGYLCPLLQDVHLRGAIGVPVPVVPCATVIREKPDPNRHLQLLAQSQGASHVHRVPQPQQVRPLDGRLGDRVG